MSVFGLLKKLCPVPQDDLAERKQKFRDGLRFRAVAASVFMILFCFLMAFNPSGRTKYLPAFPVLLALVGVNGAYWLLGRRRSFPLEDFYFHWLVDLIMIGLVLHVLGGVDAPYGFLAYLMIVITSATFISKRASYVVAAGATIMTVALVLIEGLGAVSQRQIWSHHFEPEVQVVTVAVITAFYFMFAYLAGTLADQLKEANFQLARARSLIEEQNRVLEQTVAARTAELRRRNSEIEEFVQIVTHDLKNLSVGAAETARKLLANDGVRLSARGRRYAEHLIVDTRTMNQMLRHVLGLFRADSEEVREEEVNLDELVGEILRTYAGRIEEKGIAVHVDKLGAIKGDAARIRHVIGNLLDNAIKYSGDKAEPVIKIWARQHDAGVEVVVGDNGVGIPREEWEKIFKLYQRGAVQPVGESVRSGEGVGLAISRRLVERWGGRIWVDSVVGEGSEFHFTIPGGRVSNGRADGVSVEHS